MYLDFECILAIAFSDQHSKTSFPPLIAMHPFAKGQEGVLTSSLLASLWLGTLSSDPRSQNWRSILAHLISF